MPTYISGSGKTALQSDVIVCKTHSTHSGVTMGIDDIKAIATFEVGVTADVTKCVTCDDHEDSSTTSIFSQHAVTALCIDELNCDVHQRNGSRRTSNFRLDEATRIISPCLIGTSTLLSTLLPLTKVPFRELSINVSPNFAVVDDDDDVCDASRGETRITA